MPEQDLYEGRDATDLLSDVGSLVDYAARRWIDAEYIEDVQGETTGQRITKGGAGDPVRENGDGTVTATGYPNDEATARNQGGGMNMMTLAVLALIGIGIYAVAD